MSKKFYAENRETGERWQPRKDTNEYLVMYDSGYLAVVRDNGWDGHSITPLDKRSWKKVVKDNILSNHE